MLMFSLTLEASLREVTTLRQQILRIKGESSVSSCPARSYLVLSTADGPSPRWNSVFQWSLLARN
jgi:hypothetical protein